MGRSNSATVGRAREAAAHLEDMTAASVSGQSEYEQHLVAEAATWVLGDDEARAEKLTRERMRHYGIIRALLLDKLPTHRMDIIEVGGGPLPVSDLLPFKSRVVFDPCTDDYVKIAPCPDHFPARIEDDPYFTDSADLIISTNSLDHVENPYKALAVMDTYLRPGGYMAIQCNSANAFHHPHPAHEWNLTERDIHRVLDAEYETVWELTYERDGYRYGWVSHDGRRGQPAFALTMRKCSGYPS